MSLYVLSRLTYRIFSRFCATTQKLDFLIQFRIIRHDTQAKFISKRVSVQHVHMPALCYAADLLHVDDLKICFRRVVQVQRNPWSLLPVMVSEGVNAAGLGKELLLLNWTVQHLQDPAGRCWMQSPTCMYIHTYDADTHTYLACCILCVLCMCLLYKR
jgi:hypothetical protein